MPVRIAFPTRLEDMKMKSIFSFPRSYVGGGGESGWCNSKGSMRPHVFIRVFKVPSCLFNGIGVSVV
jgi:hypothetical protein